MLANPWTRRESLLYRDFKTLLVLLAGVVIVCGAAAKVMDLLLPMRDMNADLTGIDPWGLFWCGLAVFTLLVACVSFLWHLHHHR